MDLIYKWYMKDYKGSDFWWFNIIDDNFYIEDKNILKIKWEYSKTKKKYYSHIYYDNQKWNFEFIIFQNKYILILFNKKKQIQDWDKSF